MGRWSWIIGVAQRLRKGPYKGEADLSVREGHVPTQGRGWVTEKGAQSQGLMAPSGGRKRQGKACSWSPQQDPALLTSQRQPRETDLGCRASRNTINLCCLKVTKFVLICSSSNRKLTQVSRKGL